MTQIEEGLTPWPSEFCDRYVRKGYWQGRSLAELIFERVQTNRNGEAVVDGATRTSYQTLWQMAEATAGGLLDLGLEPGDRVILQLPNCWQYVVITIACFRAGIVPVMALPGHRSHELGHMVAIAEARAIVVPDEVRGFDHEAMAHELREALPSLEYVIVVGEDVRPPSIDLRNLLGGDRANMSIGEAALPMPSSRSVALFLLSGGTTGLPKLIPRTHDDYVYNALASSQICHINSESVYLVSLPVGHNFPLGCPGLIGTLLAGGRVVMLPSPEPEKAFRAIRDERVTVTALVPAVVQRWIDHQLQDERTDLESLELIQVGGARLANEVARQVAPVLGGQLQQVFGMAEGLLNYTRLEDSEDVICSTQGRPMSEDDELRIVDAAERDVPIGAVGELLTRGPYTIRGYYRAPEQNRQAFTKDGWYRTGDLVRRRPDGNLVVEGRAKDVINRGGEKISAEDVENLAYRFTDILYAAAVAMPDRVLGERLCLYVVPRQAGGVVNLESLRKSMEEFGVAKPAWPERLEVVSELPMTKVGKIDKKALRDDIARRIEEEESSRNRPKPVQAPNHD